MLQLHTIAEINGFNSCGNIIYAVQTIMYQSIKHFSQPIIIRYFLFFFLALSDYKYMLEYVGCTPEER